MQTAIAGELRARVMRIKYSCVETSYAICFYLDGNVDTDIIWKVSTFDIIWKVSVYSCSLNKFRFNVMRQVTSQSRSWKQIGMVSKHLLNESVGHICNSYLKRCLQCRFLSARVCSSSTTQLGNTYPITVSRFSMQLWLRACSSSLIILELSTDLRFHEVYQT